MAFNVPINGIKADNLYINIGLQDVLYNAATYTTGQYFTGIKGIASFTYSGTGSQIVIEVEVFKGASLELQLGLSDLPSSFPQTLIFKGAAIEVFISQSENVFNENVIVKGGSIEFNYVPQPVSSISKRIGVINKPSILPTLPTKIAYFGDSWTGGGTSPYPILVNGINGINYINYGVSGTSVYSGSGGVPGSNLIDKYNTELSLGYIGQFVSFFYGTNDLGGLNATWKSTYKGIIQSFITAGFPLDKLMIIIPGKEVQPLSALLISYIQEIASELGILLYDVNQRFLDTGINNLLYDGIAHPSQSGINNGQAVIASGYDTFIKR